jgi:23S rRNA (pseudouridine1915-N3)-methyltransferase
MRIHILAVGDKMPAWVDAPVAEYLKRMPKEWGVSLRELRPAARASGKGVEALLQQEAQRLHAALPQGVFQVLLDERGKALTSVKFAQTLNGWLQRERSVAFLIGGADGVDATVREGARFELALSTFTLPHGLARVMLVEQLYRAASILQGHPYHRA